MPEVTNEQIAELKRIALERYSEDHGFMYECFDDQDYAEALRASSGNVENAWKAQCVEIAIQREHCACYDNE